MLTFEQLQAELRPWVEHNFGKRPSWQPALGLQEEAGELAHAVLKKAQGIRGTPEKHDAAIRDAVADLAIFLADWCNGHAIAPAKSATFADLQWAAKFELRNFPVHTAALGIGTDVGVIVHAEGSNAGARLNGRAHLNGIAADLLRSLARFCHAAKIDFQQCVEDTWGRVRQRDWKANPSAADVVAQTAPDEVSS